MKKISVIFIGSALTVLLVREIGLMEFNWYNLVSKSEKTSNLSILSEKFPDIQAVEILGVSSTPKFLSIKNGGRKLRLTIKNIFTSICWESWIPFYKSGKNEVIAYYSVESSFDGISYDRWSYVICVQKDVDLEINGICSRRQYEKIVINGIDDFSYNELSKNNNDAANESLHRTEH